jgi:hypothetical protein
MFRLFDTDNNSISLVTTTTAPMKFVMMIGLLFVCFMMASAQENDPSVISSSEVLENSALEGDPLYVRSYKKVAKIISKEEFEKINSESIQYISVITDPSSIYIYGDKAKNGVVLVVMKEDSFSGRYSGRKRRHK